MSQEVFGLDVGVVLCADETPLEVVGVVKYLNADGGLDYWVFSSESVTNVEALGMAEWLKMRAHADAETSMMMQATIDLEDDDD